jgi:biotin carboxylase
MREALEDTVIEGPRTNVAAHLRVLDDERFVSGEYDTGLLEA